jgi:hypothetical protein
MKIDRSGLYLSPQVPLARGQNLQSPLGQISAPPSPEVVPRYNKGKSHGILWGKPNNKPIALSNHDWGSFLHHRYTE